MLGRKSRSVSDLGRWARVAGALFLVSIVAGGFGEGFAPSLIIATNDAATTAHNLVASNAIFRLGFAAYLVEASCDLALTAILYVLLRQVGRIIALIGALFHVAATLVFAFGEVFYFVPSLIVGGDSYLKTFTAAQLDALVLLSLNVYGLAGGMSLLFYGAGSVGFGYLIFQSGFLPRLLGILLAFGGIAFVLRSFTLVLVPAASSPLLQLPMILALVLLGFWLVVRGVESDRLVLQSVDRGQP